LNLGNRVISDQDDIDDVRRQEQNRGKRPIDISEKRRRLILLRKFREALSSNDVEAFKEAITNDLGMMPGTPAYRDALRAWYSHHGRS